MSKQCAKCSKTVYPTEELKCLDKVWHKFCFKCSTCGMTLNLKNFQGFDKMPYCRAHTPKAKHTNVTETPEISRVKEATKNQSLAAYHEKFEKGIKGNYTQIADDPETLRLLKNQNTFSNVKYQEEFIKSKAGKMPDGELEEPSHTSQQGDMQHQQQQKQHYNQQQYSDTQRMPPGAVPERIAAPPEDNFNSPYSSRNQGSSVVYSSQGKVEQNQSNRKKVGSITDYDPMNEHYGSIAQGHPGHPGHPQGHPGHPQGHPGHPQGHPQSHQPYSAFAGQQWQETVPVSRVQAPEQQPPPVSQPPPAPPTSSSAVYKAMYDYDAADDDEVGFRDGDIIINTEPIDDGWMYGTVQRSGQTGMLPSNYVERIQ